MALLKQTSWPPYIVGIFLGLLQLPLYVMLNKTLNGSAGYAVISNWILQQFGMTIDQNIGVSITWWSAALLVGISIGAYLSAKMSGRQYHLYSTYWQELNYSLVVRIFLGLIGGILIGIGLRLAGDGTVFEELSSIAKIQFHSMITVILVFGIGAIVSNNLYTKRK